MTDDPDLPEWHREWNEVQENRYNAGYRIGGPSHPFYRKLLGEKLPWFGLLAMIAGAILLAVSFFVESKMSFVLVGLFMVFIGVANMREKSRRKPRRSN